MSSRPLRLRRSELSTPASSEKMLAKAATIDADLVFLDLEDAVAPSAKVAARATAVQALNELSWTARTRALRVNGIHTPWCYGDLIEVVSGAGANLDVIILPKVKRPRDIWFVDTLLTQLEQDNRLEVGRIGIELLIEETEALACVEAIASCCPRLEALIIGFGDLSASQGIPAAHIGKAGEAYPGDIWHYARNRVIVAARANGLDAIDGPYGDFRDEDGYREQASWGAALGAVGKWAIHPSQVPLANEVFAPTDDQIAEARTVVEAMREAEANGVGAIGLNGMLLDAASTRVFEVVLERARLSGLLPA